MAATSEGISVTEERSHTVKITGISLKTTKDALLNFFENKRRSGGGKIEDIQYNQEEGLAEITFCSAEDAENVSQKEGLKLDGTKLGLTLKELPKVLPKDPCKLHVMGLSENTTEDGLISFMELVTDKEVTSVLLWNPSAVVTFIEPPDLEKTQQKCSARAIDGKTLRVGQVNVCECIEVSGLGSLTTHDTILYYFENPRKSGGGDVEKVEYVHGETKALVFFKDPSVIDSVVDREHLINGTTVKAIPSYPFLCETPIKLEEKREEKLLEVSAQTLELIEKLFHQEFQDLLEEKQVQYTFLQSSGEVVLRTINGNAKQANFYDIETYINQIKQNKLEVSRQLWKELEDDFMNQCRPFTDRMDVTYLGAINSSVVPITISGKIPDVEAVTEMLNHLIIAKETRMEEEKKKVTKEIPLTKAQFELMSLVGFADRLQAKCTDIEVKIIEENLAVTMSGLDENLRYANEELWKCLAQFKETEVMLPESVSNVLLSDTGFAFLLKSFQSNEINAVVGFEDYQIPKIIITAASQEHLHNAVELLNSLTAEEIIPVDLISSDNWTHFMDFLQDTSLLKVTSSNQPRLILAGVKEKVETAKAQINAFFETFTNQKITQGIAVSSAIPEETPNSAEAPVTETKSHTVKVTGISSITTKDGLLNMFENKRSSGGGEIEDIQYNQDVGFAEITFCSAEDAENVSQKEVLELDGARLGLTLKELPKVLPKDPYKLHVMGLSEKTTKDCFLAYIEVVSGEEVQSMLFGSKSNVMVIFEEPPDLENIQQKCRKRPLDGSHLQIEQVGICDCIEVSGLGSKTTRDTILYYFEDPRKSGGGDVKKVEFVHGETKALVFFEEPSVVDRVVTHRHVINGETLQVVPHQPFLGEPSKEPGGGKREKQLNADPQVIAFIDKFVHKEFEELLQGNEVKLNQEQGKDEIVLVSINNKIDRAKWYESCAAIEKYINQITAREVAVSSAAWKETIQQAKLRFSTAEDKIYILCKQKEQRILLRGKKQDVDTLAEQLEGLGKEIDKKIEYEKSKITNKMVLTKPQLDLLKFTGETENLMTRFKDLEMKIDKNNLVIYFRGPDSVVKERNISIWQYLSKMKDHEMELPRSVVTILTSDAGIVFLSKQFRDHNIEAVINSSDGYDDTRLIVTAVDRRDANKAVDLIKKTTIEDSVPLDQEQKSLLLSDKWNKLDNDFKKSMLLKVETGPGSNSICIAGIKEQVNKAKEQVFNFLEEYTIIDITVGAEAGRIKYLLRFKQDEVKKIEDELKHHSLHILQDGNKEGFTIRGTKEGTDKASKKVLQLVNQIKDKSIEIEKPGIKKLFSDSKGKLLLSNIENDHTCIIERCSLFGEKNMNTAGSAAAAAVKRKYVGNVPGGARRIQGSSNVYVDNFDGMAVGKGSFSPHRQMCLKVFAFSDSILKKADAAIKELIKYHFKRKVIDKSAIEGLSPTQEERILRLQGKHFTEIDIQKRSARIIISGLSEDVSDTAYAIYEILNEKTEAEHARRYAELVSKTVQWYHIEDGKREAYDDITNAKIEEAFKVKKDSVMVDLDDESNKVLTYKIVFATMKETNIDTRDETDVHRDELGKDILLPHHWDSQPKDTKGKEKDLHLVQLDPAKNKQECDIVLAAITKTSPINIVKIERVQNPELYRAYVLKMQKMDDKDGSNEKKLFHGTPVSICDLINHKGFNRSYCGKNATWYGKGVYFARDASYSMRSTYSPPDRNGYRRMYLASVLVGQFTLGNQNMIAPPPKNPNNPTVTYDTTVDNPNDPQVFVTFHDNQVYPEYLITFI